MCVCVCVCLCKHVLCLFVHVSACVVCTMSCECVHVCMCSCVHVCVNVKNIILFPSLDFHEIVHDSLPTKGVCMRFICS